MKTKVIITVGVLAVVHFLVCVLSGALSWPVQLVVVSSATIIVTWIIVINRKYNYLTALLTVLPFYLIYTGMSIYYRSYPTYPIWAFGFFIFIITLVLIRLKVKAVAGIALLSMLVAFGGYILWPNWFAKLNTISNPERYQPFHSVIVDGRGVPLDTAALKGKVILLDVWHSACINCIKQFPEVERLHDRYKGDSLVKIISLNFPLERDMGVRPARLTAGYHFDKAYFNTADEHASFSAAETPLTLILDKQLRCRYAGPLYTEWNIFSKNAIRIINTLKHED